MSSYTKFNLVMKLKKEIREEDVNEIKDIMSYSCGNDTYCHISKGAINLRGMLNYKFDKLIRIFEIIENHVFTMDLKRIGTIDTEAIPAFSGEAVPLYCHNNKIFLIHQEEESLWDIHVCHYSINDLRGFNETFSMQDEDCDNINKAFSMFLNRNVNLNKEYKSKSLKK